MYMYVCIDHLSICMDTSRHHSGVCIDHHSVLCTLNPVPDLHIEGSLSAIHVMLDKSQLELVKGLVDMNLGEGIEDFEKPSTVIRDPIAPVSGGRE